MIERVLGHLAGFGIGEAVLSLGYRPDAFVRAYPAQRCAGVALRYAVEPEPLDTAGAIAFAAGAAGLDETFVVVNGDILTDLDVEALIGLHRERGAEATIALTPVEDPSAYGVVPTDTSGRVLAFIEKPPAGQAPTTMINAGTYILEPTVLERIPPGVRVSIERRTFPEMVAGGRLYAMGSDAAWIDAGTPGTYLAANLRHAGPPGRATTVAGDATVEGSVVGAGARIGPGARVARSVLLDGVTVCAGAAVLSSLVGRGARIGAGAVVGGLSVVGDGFVVPAGAELCGERVPAGVG